MLKVIFMGTSEFALPALTSLIASPHKVEAVVTQPDRPRGRGKKMQPTLVKKLALEKSLPVFQFEKIKEPAAVEQISSLAPDLIVVVAYGQMIPESILGLPLYGCVNVHASLLPKYRGAAPVQRALTAGELYTGVTIMMMDAGLDTGDILMQERLMIEQDINHGELESALADMGGKLLLRTIESMISGSLHPVRQGPAADDYARMITREDEKINWNLPAATIHNQIRALSPAPGAYTVLDGVNVKIFKTRVSRRENHVNASSGQFIEKTDEGLLIQTGDGCLEILEIQKAGKRKMKALEFWLGMRMETGTFGDA
ncbi:MAG: methionyl-tRNA formyltransferase [Syntrophomonadaceae bacterium]|nr:methionyl-tRNA formyltransferase [Syntrophomonadaceae bacterium]